MEERDFRRLLDLFPIVRSRDHCTDSEFSREPASHSAKDEITDRQNAWSEMDKDGDVGGSDIDDPFWQKLRLVAERKVDPAKAERFCKAFQSVYNKLVHKELSSDAARRFVDGEGK